jgi:hypothetical protein
MTILTTIFVTSCTFYQILGSYMVLVEVTRDSHVLRNAAATKPSWVAVDLILKSEDRTQLFSRKVMLLFLIRDNEVVHKVNQAWNSYIIPRHHPTSSNWIITWNTVLLMKPLAATVGPNISSCLKTPNFNEICTIICQESNESIRKHSVVFCTDPFQNYQIFNVILCVLISSLHTIVSSRFKPLSVCSCSYLTSRYLKFTSKITTCSLPCRFVLHFCR